MRSPSSTNITLTPLDTFVSLFMNSLLLFIHSVVFRNTNVRTITPKEVKLQNHYKKARFKVLCVVYPYSHYLVIIIKDWSMT